MAPTFPRPWFAPLANHTYSLPYKVLKNKPTSGPATLVESAEGSPLKTINGALIFFTVRFLAKGEVLTYTVCICNPQTAAVHTFSIC